MGSHLSIWVLWSLLSIADTCIAHSGWHLPLQHSPEAHDYHHSSGYIDNLGVMGLLDAYYGTTKHFDASWQATLNKSYGLTADYPVAKVLASGGGGGGGGSAREGGLEAARGEF